MTATITDLLTIARPDGSVLAFHLPGMTDATRAAVAEVVGDVFDDIDPAQLLVVMAETFADEAAYRRVCERRGVLAL